MCAQWIWGRIVSLYEQAASDDGEITRPKEPNWTAWANDVRTMRMLDGRTHRQICEMFGRLQRDSFWVKKHHESGKNSGKNGMNWLSAWGVRLRSVA
ncbi:putative prophage replication protein [Escherichia coli]|uniref:Putative prophage replication protein n=1 Tax=Escherichia coli TaxID=562 RepID=A0A377HH65_ECOLX|nr:putative prophage replication protein [Escherichia coli]